MGHVDDEVIEKNEIISYMGNFSCEGPVLKSSR